MDSMLQDIRYAARKLLHAPGFTIVAVLTLAIAIGATTAMFSIVNGVVLHPLPYRDPARLVYVASSINGKPNFLSPVDFLDYKAQSRSFADLEPMQAGNTATLLRKAIPAVRLSESRVGATFFSMLGVPAALGRVFAPGEDGKTAQKVVMLSDGTWRSVFGADPAIVGKPITLDGDAYTVVGVAPSSFSFPGNPDVWVPMVWQPGEVKPTGRGSHSIQAVGRLTPPATSASAGRELETIAKQLENEYPRTNTATSSYVQPLQDHIVGTSASALVAMLGAVAFVLLIACANVANLLLVRAAARESEIAVRSALGAGRARIIRQIVTESVLLSTIGAVVGAVLALWIVESVVAFGPRGLPRISEISVDGRVLLVTACMALVTGIVFGLIPAYHASRGDVSQMLRDGVRGSTRWGAARTRSGLVIAEMALAVVLLVGAGLLLRSFERLTHVDPGFSPDHLLTFNISLPQSTYPFDRETLVFVNDVMTRLRALPGVENVAVEAGRPIQPDSPFSAVVAIHSITGRPTDPPGKEATTLVFAVSPSFFSTFRVPIVRGRAFIDAENRPDVPQAVVVNQEFVRKYLPNVNPIGKYVSLGIKHDVSATPGDTLRAGGEIVGVSANVKNNSLSETVSPATYVAYGSNPFGVSVTVRTANDPLAVQNAVRSQVAMVDAQAAIYDMTTMQTEISESVSQPRFYAILLGGFSAIALLIAALGIFGVISYAVNQRTRELGIRLALGATPADVVRLVIGNGIALALVGLTIGAVSAAFLTRAIATLLFEVTPFDPLTFGSACGALFVVAAIAAWLPARRAGRVDPLVAIRAE